MLSSVDDRCREFWSVFSPFSDPASGGIFFCSEVLVETTIVPLVMSFTWKEMMSLSSCI